MLTINVFSNICEIDPSRDTIFQTLDSFQECFGVIRYKVNLFVHPSPFTRYFHQYNDSVKKYFSTLPELKIIKTRGLADGYKRSIVSAETKYLFQLEHDWLFERSAIAHSLDEIIDAMQKSSAEYFRFGKEPNARNKYGHSIIEAPMHDIPACSVLSRSNNPHIINASAYREKYLSYINDRLGGSSGVEECLPDAPGAYVYGPLNYQPTIRHIDGRSRLVRFRKSIGKVPYKAIKSLGLLEPVFKVWASDPGRFTIRGIFSAANRR